MSHERGDQEDWEWREAIREERRRHVCQCGGDMPGQCPGPAYCPMCQHEDPDPATPGDWVECWQCGGNGNVGGCFEDTCVCFGDPDDADTCCAPSRCDVCRGKGGWEQPERDPEPDNDRNLGLLNPMTAPRRVGY